MQRNGPPGYGCPNHFNHMYVYRMRCSITASNDFVCCLTKSFACLQAFSIPLVWTPKKGMGKNFAMAFKTTDTICYQ